MCQVFSHGLVTSHVKYTGGRDHRDVKIVSPGTELVTAAQNSQMLLLSVALVIFKI